MDWLVHFLNSMSTNKVALKPLNCPLYLLYLNQGVLIGNKRDLIIFYVLVSNSIMFQEKEKY